MLADGRLRICIDGPLAARRDRKFRKFMRKVLGRTPARGT
jgi:hypothetical protein